VTTTSPRDSKDEDPREKPPAGCKRMQIRSVLTWHYGTPMANHSPGNRRPAGEKWEMEH
ncbi:hypothetical protein NHX12_029565, partial [Muraenolepis orangiensis]